MGARRRSGVGATWSEATDRSEARIGWLEARQNCGASDFVVSRLEEVVMMTQTFREKFSRVQDFRATKLLRWSVRVTPRCDCSAQKFLCVRRYAMCVPMRFNATGQNATRAKRQRIATQRSGVRIG